MKNIYVSLLLSCILLTTLSCHKEELDPSLPPVIETTSSLDAENRISKLVNDGTAIDFLVDLQDDDIWRACYATNNYDNVHAYGIEARIIVDNKQKKVDKQLRNVITVYTGYRLNIYAESNYLANIYNNSTVRFYKVTASRNSRSPQCNSLVYYFTTAQAFGGTFIK